MCFVVDDYDWYPEVQEQHNWVAEKVTRCCECRREMPIGSPVHSTYLQQYEECHNRYDGECDCKSQGKDCCICAEPEFGETFECHTCDDCHKFLKAVQAAEVAAGCSYSESTPPLEQMIEYISNGGAEEAKKYYQQAVKDSPELRPYLKWLWRKMFGQ